MRLALMFSGMILFSGVVLLAVIYLLIRGKLPQITTGGSELTSGSPEASSVDLASAQLRDYRSGVLDTLLQQSMVALGILVVVAALLGWLAAHRMLRPVQTVVATARRLGAGNLSERIRMPGKRDELTDLADTFDDMLDRLAAAFDSQRRFVANASHELRTPLAAQRTLIEVALAKELTASQPQPWSRLLDMNARIEAIIEGLLALARSDRGLPSRRLLRLDELAQSVAASHQAAIADRGLTLVLSLQPRCVLGDEVLLERLLSNLLDNAIKYNHAGGELRLTIGEGQPAVQVANTGPDVPAAASVEIFEPFYQLKRHHQGAAGAGLGLSIVASIARAHRGSAEAQPRPGGGLVLYVYLPVAAEVSASTIC